MPSQQASTGMAVYSEKHSSQNTQANKRTQHIGPRVQANGCVLFRLKSKIRFPCGYIRNYITMLVTKVLGSETLNS